MDLIERKTSLTSHQYCHYWMGIVKMFLWISSVIPNISATSISTTFTKTENQLLRQDTLSSFDSDCFCWLTAAPHDYWLGCNELSITAIGCMDSLEMQCLLLWQLLSYSFVSACTALIMTTGVFETCNGFGMLFLNGCVNHVCLKGHDLHVLMQAPCHYCFLTLFISMCLTSSLFCVLSCANTSLSLY